jgi:exonuclease SbcC
MESLNVKALELAQELLLADADEAEPLAAFLTRIVDHVAKAEATLKARLSAVRTATETLSIIVAHQRAADDLRVQIEARDADRRRVLAAFNHAERLRADVRRFSSTVSATRNAIVQRVFNDRLNTLWRDLFVRLAPSEDYVPAFRVPPENQARIVPSLETRHRSGSTGGTPGAMLSSANLNTAALTLFLALHLSVPPRLPWLILDDPVQSMDEVHIAHFAALLRTISKEHSRHIVIAVHDRPLFEYLSLELAPAYAGDELITIEISTSGKRQTRYSTRRHTFVPDTSITPLAA